ncbi:hypothetical protein QTP70_004981 [Hemibagrus guttatus]|uniref:Uncharacterized protein n=1 Tax=Hemibagrus guttatus TaxID=175788 RepID=A0AAE0PPS0_9TELE|nr:hypothetical protein QTP70_004981 [Hemibagrus guttatus]
MGLAGGSGAAGPLQGSCLQALLLAGFHCRWVYGRDLHRLCRLLGLLRPVLQIAGGGSAPWGCVWFLCLRWTRFLSRSISATRLGGPCHSRMRSAEDLSGSEDHLFRHCPSRKGTFADLFAEDLEAVAAPPRQQQEAPGSGTAREPGAVGEAGVSAEEAADHPEEQRPPPTESAGAEGDPRLESQPAEGQSAELTTTGGEASGGFGDTQSTWTPVDWEEALEGVEAAPSPVHPDWAMMEFTDSLTSGSPGPDWGTSSLRQMEAIMLLSLFHYFSIFSFLIICLWLSSHRWDSVAITINWVTLDQ